MKRIKTFIIECRRVFRVTRKPTRQELITMVKVCGIGMLLIGFIGFLFYFAATIVRG